MGFTCYSAQGWAVGDVELPKPGRYSVSCTGLNTVYLSSAVLGASGANATDADAVLVPLAADQYGGGRVKAAVDVTAAALRAGAGAAPDRSHSRSGGGSTRGGVLTLFAHVRAKVSGKFGCAVEGPLESASPKASPKAKAKAGVKAGRPVKLARVQAWPPPWMPDLVGDALMGVAPGVAPDVWRGSGAGGSIGNYSRGDRRSGWATMAPLALPVFNPSGSAQSLVSARAANVRDGLGDGARRVGVRILGGGGGEAASSLDLPLAPGQTAMLPLLLEVAGEVASEVTGAAATAPSAFSPCTPLTFDLVLAFAPTPAVFPGVGSSTDTEPTVAATENVAGDASGDALGDAAEKMIVVVRGLALRCRSPSQSFLFSFLDHDGTPSRAAAVAPPDAVDAARAAHRAPKKRSKKKAAAAAAAAAASAGPGFGSGAGELRVPVLLSLHGTSISPESQADSYKRKDDPGAPDYTFGVAGLWVVAPSRHGAHNWEHTGHLTALAATDALGVLSASVAWSGSGGTGGRGGGGGGGGGWSVPAADPRRCVYGGHSMGGHGAWLLATLHPARAIAVVSAAG